MGRKPRIQGRKPSIVYDPFLEALSKEIIVDGQESSKCIPNSLKFPNTDQYRRLREGDCTRNKQSSQYISGNWGGTSKDDVSSSQGRPRSTRVDRVAPASHGKHTGDMGEGKCSIVKFSREVLLA
jgi:hypothetical protein